MDGAVTLTVTYPPEKKEVTFVVTTNSSLIGVFQMCRDHFGLFDTEGKFYYYLDVKCDDIIKGMNRFYNQKPVKLYELKKGVTKFEIKRKEIEIQPQNGNISKTGNVGKTGNAGKHTQTKPKK